MSTSRRLAAATLLGAVCGMRTFTGPAALALRGRIGGGPARVLLPVAAAGEAVGDKLAAVPARTSPPALAGRLASGGLCGIAVAGASGAALGLLGAAAGAFGGQRARAALGRLTGWPDPMVGMIEDGAAASLAALATAA